MRLALAFLLIGRAALAQCPDGSAPPCASARAPRPVDANRIAILPFRVTTTDTLLGEGFAELLASEFSSDEGPRAIDMATVISAWRRAGGGLRTPLPREKALILARELGAGLLSEGSIVGLGNRITITTNIVNASSGAARGRPTRVTASHDSVDQALRLTASGLVAALGGQQRTLEGARFTESPEAMRAYLEGLSLWRRGRLHDGLRFFERAMTLDSSFAQAAFRRYLAGSWGLRGGTITNADAIQRTHAQRARLSDPERQIVEGMLGKTYGVRPTVAQRLASLTKIAEALPDSPEAQFLLGDTWYHFGVQVDAANHVANARHYIRRAVAIDSIATGIRHLIELAVVARDTADLRRLLPVYGRTEDAGRWGGLFAGYSILGDERELARLRQLAPGSYELGAQWPYIITAHAVIPKARMEEMHRLWIAATPDRDFRSTLALTQGLTLAIRGRLLSAESAWVDLNERDAQEADRFRLTFDMSGDARGLDVQGAIARLSSPAAQRNPVNACQTALWRILKGTPTPDDGANGFAGNDSCSRSIRFARMLRDSVSLSERTLEAADSAASHGMVTGGTQAYETALVARAWERAGRFDRAHAAMRYRGSGLFTGDVAWTFPEEIRLGLAARDTAAALHRLEFYLPLIEDAEPPYAAKRDSLRTLLTQLRRR